MKATELRSIMSEAWRLFKVTGEVFADCLKKVWQLFKLAKAMRKGIVKFYFKKVYGSVREAFGTLSTKLMPETKDSDRKPNDTVQTYFDTEVQEFRCFKKANLISIINIK